ncbi:MAG: hypothetical protein LBR77_03315 [Lachnospiraceae bacterium]|jgi:hypothetical protein|nr:hypothetical protein [Lachnospiraceae bacterium]
MPVVRIARMALLGAVLYVAQVALAFLPNVELVSLLLICYTMVFGKDAFLCAAVFVLCELLQWGFGVWWLSYLYVWPLLVLAALLLRGALGEEFLVWAVVSGVFGLCFGALFAVAYLPVGPAYAVTYWVSGLPFDVWHAVCNFTLMLVLGKPVYRLLVRLAGI